MDMIIDGYDVTITKNKINGYYTATTLMASMGEEYLIKKTFDMKPSKDALKRWLKQEEANR